MLSTRRDLFPAEIADELALLQDNVEAFSGKDCSSANRTSFGFFSRKIGLQILMKMHLLPHLLHKFILQN